jgi:hypothetical protein
MSSATAEGVTSKTAASSAPRDSLSRLADVELQLVMQFLDADSLLKLARCSRQALHCATNPLVWRNHLVDVTVTSAGPRMDPRATARSLLHFKPSRACLEGNELISCETLAAVPKLAAVRFHVSHVLMAASDCQRFFSLPVAQRLVELELTLRVNSFALHQLTALPLLHTVKLQLAVGIHPSVLQPLIHAPSLTHVRVAGDYGSTPMSVLMPLAGCMTLCKLELIGLLHQPRALRLLSERLLQNGGRLKHLGLAEIGDGDDVGTLVVDLFFAARFLPHLESLQMHGEVMTLFPAVAAMPSLRLLQLQPKDETLCSHVVEDLLQVNRRIRVHMQFDTPQLCTPELSLLVASHSRLQIRGR